MKECNDAVLPVVLLEQPYMSGNEAARFYGYYLPHGAQREWLTINYLHVREAVARPPLADVIAARISGTDRCPLLLWTLNALKEEYVVRVRDLIEANSVLPEGRHILVRRFTTPSVSRFRFMIGDTAHGMGYQIVVEDR